MVPAPPAVPQTKEVHPDAIQHPQARTVSRQRPLDRSPARCSSRCSSRRSPSPPARATPVLGGARNPSSNAVARVHAARRRSSPTTAPTARASRTSPTNGGGAIYGCRSAPAAPEGQRALRARQQPGRRPRVRVRRRAGHRGRPHRRPDGGRAVHDDRDRRGDRPERRQGRRQGRARRSRPTRTASRPSPRRRRARRPARRDRRGARGRRHLQRHLPDDISKCALGATETANAGAGLATAELGADNKTVTVVTRDARTAGAPATNGRSTSRSPADLSRTPVRRPARPWSGGRAPVSVSSSSRALRTVAPCATARRARDARELMRRGGRWAAASGVRRIPVRYSDTVRRTVDVRPRCRARRRPRASQPLLGGRSLVLTASVRRRRRRPPRHPTRRPLPARSAAAPSPATAARAPAPAPTSSAPGARPSPPRRPTGGRAAR